MRDVTAPEKPSSNTFTELNVRQEKGKPHFIRLHDSVVKRLERHLADNPASTGLLLGSIDVGDTCTIAVEQFEPTTKLEDLIRARKSSTPKVVGYYRAYTRENFTLEPADRSQFQRCFPKESRLALFVKPPKADVGTAMFFLGENGALAAERATVEFPFNLRELGAEEPPAASGPAAAAPAPIAAAASVSPAAPKAGRGGVFWKIAVAGVVVIASVFGLSELRVFDRPDAQAQPKQAAPETAPPAPVEQQPADASLAIPPEIKESQPAKAAKPEPAKPVPAPTPAAAVNTNTKPAGPVPSEKLNPATSTPSAPQTLVAETAAPTPAPIQRPPVRTRPAAPVPDAQPPVSTERSSTSPIAAPPTPAPTPKPVEPSLPYTPPSAIRQSAPVVPDNVRRSINGEVVVRVRVNVDASGKVIAAEPVSPDGPVAEALATSAISAVKRWQFDPARRGGDKVAGDIVLSFTFRK
jgi:TonB family protein